MQLTHEKSKAGPVAILVLVSWLGMVIHNAVELPHMPFYRPEYLFPALLSLGLYLAWRGQPHRRKTWGWLLFVWAGIHFVIGAMLSAIPLQIWPFSPEQSLGHYLSHVIYGLAQLPLMWALWRINR